MIGNARQHACEPCARIYIVQCGGLCRAPNLVGLPDRNTGSGVDHLPDDYGGRVAVGTGKRPDFCRTRKLVWFGDTVGVGLIVAPVGLAVAPLAAIAEWFCH
jgi:hypothetical protein